MKFFTQLILSWPPGASLLSRIMEVVIVSFSFLFVLIVAQAAPLVGAWRQWLGHKAPAERRTR